MAILNGAIDQSGVGRDWDRNEIIMGRIRAHGGRIIKRKNHPVMFGSTSVD